MESFALVTGVLRRGDGQGRVNLEIVRRALARGLRVTVVAREVAQEVRSHPRLEWRRVGMGRIPSQLLKEVLFSRISARILSKGWQGPLLSNGCITTVPADVNACHFVHSAWLASPVHASRLLRGPAATYQKFYSSVNSRWEKRAYRKAGTVVAVSGQVRQELCAIGIDPARIVAVPNGVDSAEFAPGVPERVGFGLPAGVPLGLFAGDIRSPRKNLDTVLRAVAAVPTFHLAVAGSLEASPYPRMAAELGVGDRVHFLGMVREMPRLMRSCDAFVFPSRYEACSLVMLEALASGLPVVTCRTTGGAELVPEDGGYLLDDPEDIAGLITALVRISSEPDDLRSRSVNARARGMDLSWEGMADRYLEILEGSGRRT